MKTYLIKHDSDTPRRETPKVELKVMPFGKFKGWSWDRVPSDYLQAVSDNFYRDRPGIMPDQRFNFRVPIEVQVKAREELKRRGYKKRGERWEYDR
jgi:hypothetical protein